MMQKTVSGSECDDIFSCVDIKIPKIYGRLMTGREIDTLAIGRKLSSKSPMTACFMNDEGTITFNVENSYVLKLNRQRELQLNFYNDSMWGLFFSKLYYEHDWKRKRVIFNGIELPVSVCLITETMKIASDGKHTGGVIIDMAQDGEFA